VRTRYYYYYYITSTITVPIQTSPIGRSVDSVSPWKEMANAAEVKSGGSANPTWSIFLGTKESIHQINCGQLVDLVQWCDGCLLDASHNHNPRKARLFQLITARRLNRESFEHLRNSASCLPFFIHASCTQFRYCLESRRSGDTRSISLQLDW